MARGRGISLLGKTEKPCLISLVRQRQLRGNDMDQAKQPPEARLPAADPWGFTRRLTIATLSMLLAILTVHVLHQGKPILLPLFVAVLICYLLLPPYKWLSKHGASGILGAVFIMVAIVGALFGLGASVFISLEHVATR